MKPAEDYCYRSEHEEHTWGKEGWHIESFDSSKDYILHWVLRS